MTEYVVDMLVTTVLALIMLGIGLSLTIEDFRRIFYHPASLWAALFSQMLVLPLIAFLIAYWSPLSPELKVGIIILAASPGGSTSGLLTYMLRGNVALSVSLTTLNSLLTLVSIPLIVNAALDYFMHTQKEINLPFGETMWHIFSITLIPALSGVGIRHRFPRLATDIERVMKYLLLVALFVVFGVKMFAREDKGGTGLTWDDAIAIAPYALLLNVACFAFGYCFLWLWKRPPADRMTAAIESGVHNTALAILIAGTLIGNQTMVKPALIYALLSFWLVWLAGGLMNKYLKHTS